MAAERHTFLFGDLVGFTALTAAEGDDRAAEVALALHEHVDEIAGNYRADAIKTIGDAVMLRCDDPGLAVELGLRIVEDLDAIPGFPPVRVGVHTGTAVNRNGDWYGGAVNVAARLCGAAGGGEVLVSAATCEAAGRRKRIALAPRRLHWLKNVTEPVPAHLASRRECPWHRVRLLRGVVA
ncbi:MAG TPA: adenylate/guanylate cyclase domain-containing protein [Thermoleophilaceae bacterium]|nr:adenylate/guanylate cyclase domain-containing protein [Thermoleophilaceae bacterium]